jgi:hypothetical protein
VDQVKENLMKNLSALIVLALVVTMTHPAASGSVGVYGMIERVVFEPNETSPERVQVWGTFAFANGGVGDDSAWSPVKRGYLYFKLPASGVAKVSDIEMIKREWADLKAVAGTGQAVGFGRWGYIGRFDDLQKEGQPWFLERGPEAQVYTDLRVRSASAAPSAPASYQTNTGVVKIFAEGSHADLVRQLRGMKKQ